MIPIPISRYIGQGAAAESKMGEHSRSYQLGPKFCSQMSRDIFQVQQQWFDKVLPFPKTWYSCHVMDFRPHQSCPLLCPHFMLLINKFWTLFVLPFLVEAWNLEKRWWESISRRVTSKSVKIMVRISQISMCPED